MTQIVDTGTGIPAVVITSQTELSARSGGILRALATGAVVRIDNLSLMCEVALMIPPALIPAVMELIGIDPGALPLPGEVRDAV